jgi:hypothetical protein
MVMRVRDAEFWRMATIVVSAFLAVALFGLASLAFAFSQKDNVWEPGDILATIMPAQPLEPAPSASSPADPPDLADQASVAWGVATGWPNSEKWGYILSFTSVGDDLLVHTNLTEPADQSELCTLLFQLNDPVLALDPPIDQVLVLGTDGQVIWSCMVTSEVQ